MGHPKVKLAFFFSLLLGSAMGLSFLQPPAAAAAQDSSSEVTLAVTAGYDNYYKEGASWIPVLVTAANDGSPIEGELRVVTGGGASNRVVYSSPVSLPTQSNKRVPMYVYVQGITDRLTVTLLDRQGNVVREAEGTLDRLQDEALLYGVVSGEPTALDFLENVTGDRPEAAVALLGVEDLPPVTAALNALDVLIMTNVDSGRLTSAQREALEGWVSTGGQLVVAGGPGWRQTTAALADLLPVTVTGSESRDDLPTLRALGRDAFRDPGPYVVATGRLRDGSLLLYEDDLPLLARRPHGAGAVYYLALDPNLAPLLDWQGNARLWSEIAGRVAPLPFWAKGARNSYSAAQALRSLPSLRLPSGIGLFLFLLLYVVVVGPVNYLVLKRLGRREWAWITIPAIIVTFSMLAYLTGFRLRGNTVVLNQMSIAYGHVDGDQMRVNSLLGVYSPRRATYDVLLPDDVLIRPFDRDYGGMAGSGNLRAIARGSDVVLDDVRVDVSGLETFVADSYRPAPEVTGQATLRLMGGGAELEIAVQNNGSTALANTGFLYGNSFLPLGDLLPGAARTTRTRLTGGQASAAASGVAPGAPGGFASGGSPFFAHYAEMLGAADYSANPETFPRYQLLESMVTYSGPGSPTHTPASAVTLMAWSEQPQFDVTLDGAAHDLVATTLYFLEIPLTEVTAGGEGVAVPRELLNWRVVDESGFYPSGITNFYMPPGWIEIEFEPWPTFQAMDVTDLEFVLEHSSGASGLPAPLVQLWDWERESWATVPDAVWGRMVLADFEQYLGERNQVRVRLQNESNTGIRIREVYPLLTGDFE